MHSVPDRPFRVVTGAIGLLVMCVALVAVAQLRPLRQHAPQHTPGPGGSVANAAARPSSSDYTSVVGLGDSVTAAASFQCPSFISLLGH